MSSTKKDVSPNLLDLFDSKENLTFCTYKELGLLCFDGHHLALVSVLPPQSGHSTPVFVKTSVSVWELKRVSETLKSMKFQEFLRVLRFIL